jgi:hypothetical protein
LYYNQSCLSFNQIILPNFSVPFPLLFSGLSYIPH